VLTTPVAEDVGLDMFVKLTEEKRRERQRRLDAGDETARLKFLPQAMAQKSAGSGGGNVRPAGLLSGKGQQKGSQEPAASPAAGSAMVTPPAAAAAAGAGGNRSTPYGQGAYGQGGLKPAGGAGKGGGGGWGGGGGSWKKW